jgi:hypothetical protein
MHFTSEPRRVTDPALADILAQLMRREPIFHRSEFGTMRTDFEKMMSDDFWEVGASGRRYSRECVLDLLDQRFQQPDRHDVWEASDFYCMRLSHDIYLLTYTLFQDGTRRTRRSTIWQQVDQDWKAIFHQGTIVQD